MGVRGAGVWFIGTISTASIEFWLIIKSFMMIFFILFRKCTIGQEVKSHQILVLSDIVCVCVRACICFAYFT